MSGKSLMTQYIEGTIVSRELRDMLNDFAAEARFEREMRDDIDLYSSRSKLYGHDNYTDLNYAGLHRQHTRVRKIK